MRRWHVFAVPLVVGSFVLGLTGCNNVPAQQLPEVDPRPNILIILTDDQRDSMGFLPKVRRFFGRGGTKFTRGFANTPLCCPARATLMTGQYAHNNGVWRNTDAEDLNQQNTLQADLQAAGYRTAIFGKYLNRFPIEETAPPGFDRFAVFRSGGSEGGDSDYYRHGTWNVNGNVRTVDRYSNRFIQDKSIDFIRSDNDAPWLMFVSVAAPHAPFIPERRYASAPVGAWDGNPAVHEKNRSDKPEWNSTFNADVSVGREIRRKQARTLMSVNDLVGEIASALRDTDQVKNTLAFFTTDNGYLWGEHGMIGKPSPYMPTIKVPFFARWPGHIEAGRRARRLVSHIDVTATAYEAASVMPDHQIDGYPVIGSRRRERLLTEMMVPSKGSQPPWSSLVTRSGDHYIEYRSDGRVVFRELYNLDRDPWELRNIARRRPEKVARLAARLENDRDCTASACP